MEENICREKDLVNLKVKIKIFYLQSTFHFYNFIFPFDNYLITNKSNNDFLHPPNDLNR